MPRKLIIALLLAAGPLPAQDWSALPKLGADDPVLLFSQNAFGSVDNELHAAWFADGDWFQKLLLSAVYVVVEPLEGKRFLISHGPSAQDNELGLVDLGRGTYTKLTSRRGHSPIGFERPGERFRYSPQRGHAYLIQDADGAADLELIAVDYRAGTFSPRPVPKPHFPDPFDAGLRLRIGADGEHIAFLEGRGAAPDAPRALRYRIRVLHFSNMSVNTIVEEVTALPAASADTPFAWPAFEFQGQRTIIYASATPGAGESAEIAFHRVDVETGEGAELFRQTLPLTRSDSVLRYDGKSGDIRYQHGGTGSESIVVAEAMTLMPRRADPVFTVKKDDRGVVNVRHGGLELLTQEHFGEVVLGASAKDGDWRAFALATPPGTQDKARQSELFATLGGGPVTTLAGPTYYCAPLAWLE